MSKRVWKGTINVSEISDGKPLEIELWNDKSIDLSQQLKAIAFVDMSSIPLWIVSSSLLSIFSTNASTSAFFTQMLLSSEVRDRVFSYGLLVSHSLIIFAHITTKVCISAFRFNHFSDIGAYLNTSFSNPTFLAPSNEDERQARNRNQKLDKLLQKRSSTLLAREVAKATQTSKLQSKENEIRLAKVILSALRLRGINAKGDGEVLYTHTLNAASFALRGKRTIEDMHRVVEQLLEIFLDS
ncbi:hypothetical protein V1512DRAFT_265771 [Lipomyces arxii]|uniref:uncharacterized protein n=1 Tax=Lipomyces arxii TaxID=56418 RepID=UPI0034CF1A3C